MATPTALRLRGLSARCETTEKKCDLAVTDLEDLKHPHLDGDARQPARPHVYRYENPVSEVAVFHHAVYVALPHLHPIGHPQGHLPRPASHCRQTTKGRVPFDIGVDVLQEGIMRVVSEHRLPLEVGSDSLHELPHPRDEIRALARWMESTHDLHVLSRHRLPSLLGEPFGGS